MGLRAYRKLIYVTLVVALGAVTLSAAAVAGFYYRQAKQAHPQAAVSTGAEVPQDIIRRVGALYDLPSDEQPTIAEIQHQDKLKDQAFFNNAQNGDSIIIYAKARLAIIYRQSTNKIINVGPVNYSDAL